MAAVINLPRAHARAAYCSLDNVCTELLREPAASQGNELRCGSLLRCHAARRQFEGAYAPRPGGLVRAAGEQCRER